MIISASRRTDIPAFYAEWFINRIKAGYCAVPNPFNREQVSYVSLRPEDVDVIVFWTRNPRPLLAHLPELDQRGYKYYFQYTLMDNPREIDPKSPPVAASLKIFQELAGQIGPERVIWRYDPIVFSNLTGADFHRETFRRLAEALRGHTRRAVISVVDDYRKANKRIKDLAQQGVTIAPPAAQPGEQFAGLMRSLADIAAQNELEIVSCAEDIDLTLYHIQPGKCIDDVLIQKIFKLDVLHQKDASQRKECGCVVSKDIGMYDSCLFGCRYCYATQSFETARAHFDAHNPQSPSLVGWYDAKPKPAEGKKQKATTKNNQPKLF